MHTNFGATSTTDEVLDGIDLHGKRILATGASAGLGVETCRALVARGIRANAVHPGVIQTELGRHMTPSMIEQILASAPEGAAMSWKTIPQGAATTVWSGFRATGEEVGGRYCEDCHVASVTDDLSVREGVRAYAIDPARADALWTKSEQMVHERFDFS